MSNISLQEITRKKRVISMMITMHSILRDRYKIKSQLVDVLLLISAVILNALVFVDFNYLSFIFPDLVSAQTTIGIFSIIVFASSVVLLVVNWKQISENHNRAIDLLFPLLDDCRRILVIENENEQKISISEFEKKYVLITKDIIPIPDKKFNSLKAIHMRKVLLSRLISKNPGAPLSILKIYVLAKSSFKIQEIN